MAEKLEAEVIDRLLFDVQFLCECNSMRVSQSMLRVILMHSCQVNRHKQLVEGGVAGGHEGGMEELKDFVDKKVC
jgi:hypothetical protein